MGNSKSCFCPLQGVFSCAKGGAKHGSSESEVDLTAPPASESDRAAVFCAAHVPSGSESTIERTVSGLSKFEVQLTAPPASEGDRTAIFCAPHVSSGSENTLERTRSSGSSKSEAHLTAPPASESDCAAVSYAPHVSSGSESMIERAASGLSESEAHLTACPASESDRAAVFCAADVSSGSESIIEKAVSGSFSSVDIEIERSKSHSSMLSDPESMSNEEVVVAESEDRRIFKDLQSHSTWGSFFKTFDDGKIVVGEKIAEGGQAEIYMADWRINPADRGKSSISEEQIELSKAHWTQLAQLDEDEDKDNEEDEDEVKLKEEETAKVRNKQVFKELQDNSPWGKSFYYEFEEDEMVMAEKKFAKGGQAELYYAQIKWRNSDLQKLYLQGKDLLKDGNEYVLKVFKKGTFLEDLKEQLAQAMLKFHATRVNEWMTQRYICDVVCATLLEDGRFAFVLQKEQSDLRKLIDRHKELHIGRLEGVGPFPKEVIENLMYEIALGMEWLHAMGIVHRDLKASNVLVRESRWNYCFVANYECSVGTIGTGFWRAPEILEAVKARNARETRVVHKCC